MLLLISNVEGFLELLHSYGIGWTGTTNFWTWLNLKELNAAPALPYTWAPRYWFWWSASRVVQDFDLRGNFLEIIDEFPFFSYLLGDLHPHVLAMPFGLLAAALALNLYLGGAQGITNLFGLKIPVRKQALALMAVVLGGLAFLNTWDFPIYLAIVSGALLLSQVNERGWSWNLLEEFLKFSIPLAIFSIVLYLPFYLSFSSQAGGILPNIIFPTRGAHLWVMFATLFVPLFLFLAWLSRPIRLSNRTFPTLPSPSPSPRVGGTEGGPTPSSQSAKQIVPALSLAAWKTGFGLTLTLILILWLSSLILGIFASQTEIGRSFITAQGLTSTLDVITAATLRRIQYSGSLLTLILLIGTALSHLIGTPPVAVHRTPPPPDASSSPATPPQSPPQARECVAPDSDTHPPSPLPFVMMFIIFGGLLVIAPEFFYLRDQFGWRMNTIFKFYYQAWELWSLAAAFGLAVMLRDWSEVHRTSRSRYQFFAKRYPLSAQRPAESSPPDLLSKSNPVRQAVRCTYWIGAALILLVLIVGLTYPILSLPNKTENFNAANPERRTLDGAAYLATYNPDDYAAINWLALAKPGVVAEAVGGGYSEFARVSTYSGHPSVLGWTNHESQWRGGAQEMGTRAEDISRLYTTPDWNEARNILDRYKIRYVFVGRLERTTYPVNELKFADNLSEVYRQGEVVIYAIP